jgi:hypothetical protein
MSHPEQQKFVEISSKVIKSYFNERFPKTDIKVLEVGSFDVNGGVRGYFDKFNYTGIDLIDGPGVDIVCSGHLFESENKFDIVICCECFEHDIYWQETFKNMYSLAGNSGVIVVTVASLGRLEHGTIRTSPLDSPGTSSKGMDYYHNISKFEFKKFLKKNTALKFAYTKLVYNYKSSDLYFIGFKEINNQYIEHLNLVLENSIDELLDLPSRRKNFAFILSISEYLLPGSIFQFLFLNLRKVLDQLGVFPLSKSQNDLVNPHE